MGTAGYKTHWKTFSVLLAVIIITGAGIWFVKARHRRIKRVILISIDTCRADHLGCYGFDRPTTPQIDALAREGMLFLRAQTPVPLTLPAHSSILTGLYPPSHNVHDNHRYRLRDTQITLAEILQQNGFAIWRKIWPLITVLSPKSLRV
ncbi:MAG: sulfatase-like hydrolase/transferase [Planctomycetes bacterium]|nr:sulfatase-like hydrolase/transferase [Planctomycetota bacterium]